jgi:ribosome-associated toxin RatA of RatAB toxin-antitoxin module
MKVFNLEAENEVQKIFKSLDTDVFIGKAFDEDTNKHFIVFSIPLLAEVNVQHIQYPFQFDTEVERDDVFKNINMEYVSGFIDKLVNQIKENQRKVDEGNI